MTRKALFIGAMFAVVLATAVTAAWAEPERKDEPRREGGDRPEVRREGDKPRPEADRPEARREGDKPRPDAGRPEVRREGDKPRPAPDVQAIAEQFRFQRGLLEVLSDPAMAAQIAIIKIKELAAKTNEVGPALEAMERIAKSDVPPGVRNSALLTRAELLEKSGRISEAFETLAQIAASKPQGDEVAAQAQHVSRWLNEHPDVAGRIIQNFQQTRGGAAPGGPAVHGTFTVPVPPPHGMPGMMPAPGQPPMVHGQGCPCPMCQGKPGTAPAMPGGCPMMQGRPGATPAMPGGCPMMQGRPGAAPVMPGGCPMMQGKPGAAPAHVPAPSETRPPHAEGMRLEIAPDQHVQTWVMSSAAAGEGQGDSISVQVQARPEARPEMRPEAEGRPIPVRPDARPGAEAGEGLRVEVRPPGAGENVRGWVTIQRPGQEPIRRPLGGGMLMERAVPGPSVQPAPPSRERSAQEVCEAVERQLAQLREYADRLERRTRELEERAGQIERRGVELRGWAKELDQRERPGARRDDDEDRDHDQDDD